MRSSVVPVFGLALAGVMSFGCQQDSRRTAADAREAREAEPRSAEAQVPTTRAHRSAVRSIASARCEREERCGNIGADAKFASKDACLERVRTEWAEDLNARECPTGVRDSELDECIEDIRGEDCGSPLDSLQRMLSCGTAEICSEAG